MWSGEKIGLGPPQEVELVGLPREIEPASVEEIPATLPKLVENRKSYGRQPSLKECLEGGSSAKNVRRTQ